MHLWIGKIKWQIDVHLNSQVIFTILLLHAHSLKVGENVFNGRRIIISTTTSSSRISINVKHPEAAAPRVVVL